MNKKNKEGVSPLELARKMNSRSLQLAMEWHLKVEESVRSVRKEVEKVYGALLVEKAGKVRFL